MPQPPPQTEQLARLVEGSRAQDEQLALGIDALQQRWATIHADWSAQAEAALVEGADASTPPLPRALHALIAQMDSLLARVAAGERALLGDEDSAGDAARRARAQRLLNESLAKHIASAINPLQQAMLTGDAALEDEVRRALSATRSAVDRAIQETTLLHAREVHAARAEELGADRFIYLGPADSRNRPFCAGKVGKTFTREEIAQLDNGQGLDVMTRCGGWGCRHHWRAMPLAYEGLAFLAVDKNAFIQGRSNEISTWDQDFIDRGIEPVPQDFVNLFRQISQDPDDDLARIANLLDQGHISLRVVDQVQFAKMLNTIGATAQDAQGITIGTTSYIPRSLLRATLVGHELTHAYLEHERLQGYAPTYESLAVAKMWDILYDAMIDEEVTAHLVEDTIRQGLGLVTLFPNASENDIIDYMEEFYDEHVTFEIEQMRQRYGS